jgi:rubrerythrin
MDNKEMADNLGSLYKLDIDASRAYGQAIEEIEHADIRMKLSEFRNDHERHIDELAAAIRELGEVPPERSPDFKGYLIEGFTALRSKTGTEGALKAMQGNEKLTNKKYGDARSWALTPTARSLIEKNYEDERRHLEYIEVVLESRSWEK